MDVNNNADQERFIVRSDGNTAFLKYQLRGDTIMFIHTEVPSELEGQGIGSALAKTGLEYARVHHLKVVPLCPFVRSYIKRHTEYQDLVENKI